MSKVINIKRGFDIKLAGNSELVFENAPLPEMYALKPSDFRGIKPKLLIKEGAEVKAGTPIFYSKDNEKVVFCSPVSGHVSEIVRGEKRVLLEILIKSDGKNDHVVFEKADPEKLTGEEIIEKMLNSGIWPLIRQRPFATIANPTQSPKAIFISAFDSSPLATDNNFVVEGKSEEFQTGINALRKLTSGKVHLNLPSKQEVSSVFKNANGVEITYFNGPHPAGNVGVQIHHINPLNKGEVVWYAYPQDVIMIGKLFTEGKYNAERIINLCGSEATNRKYFKTLIGANIENIVKDNVKQGDLRYISGNVLTGTKTYAKGFLSFYDTQLTVIPEGNYHEFIGWFTPGLKKLSFSGTFLSNLFSRKNYLVDTNTHGGERAFIKTGDYEKVFPFDIYPVQLLKSIIAEDIENMENLGIYEVAPEDFALCEFICLSKINSQKIVEKGIELTIKELG